MRDRENAFKFQIVYRNNNKFVSTKLTFHFPLCEENKKNKEITLERKQKKGGKKERNYRYRDDRKYSSSARKVVTERCEFRVSNVPTLNFSLL